MNREVNIDRLAEEFSREVVTSQNAKTTLNRIYRFCRKFMPVDFLNLPIFDPVSGSLHYKAFVSDDGIMLADEKVRFSGSAREQAGRYVGEKIIYINNTHREPLTIDIINHLGIREVASTLFIIAPLEERRFGVLGLIAWGEGRYNEQHLRIMERLYTPLTGVVSQILAHFEISSQKERLVIENKAFKKRLGYRIIGAESGLKEVMGQVEKVAALDIPVLLTGETGVGKEVIANAIHNFSNRVDGPLVSFNCGAIPENLVESELFGYEKGAFTGAHSLHHGYFEQADEGTVFMDEIGELSLSAQVSLLRFLQTMELRRIGGRRTISVDARVVAATNRDIQVLVQQGRFRADLWYRLNVFPIHIPSLRERKEDIPELARYFARRQALEMNLPYSVTFSPEAMNQLQAYDWPGNIRELKNVIERALIVCQGAPLTFDALTVAGGGKEPPAVVGSEPGEGFPTLDRIIASHIRAALKLSRGRVEGRGGAAQLLGLHPSTLRAKMRKHGIRIERVAR
ncbi:MAG: sigma-54-dependent Fis family transcriptional regulator [Deltaproteobacteria bacterium]|nr:sigma-54-dependent Fis family transcriptional regulator [Deltaproteobacteria bacterium]